MGRRRLYEEEIMTKKWITADRIMESGPCERWPEERVRKHVPGRVTADEMLRIKSVPVLDRMWVVWTGDFVPQWAKRRWFASVLERGARRLMVHDKEEASEALLVADSIRAGKSVSLVELVDVDDLVCRAINGANSSKADQWECMDDIVTTSAWVLRLTHPCKYYSDIARQRRRENRELCRLLAEILEAGR